MIYVFGIALTFFIAALLVGEKHKGVSNIILSVWLCVIGLHLLGYYTFRTGAYVDFPFYLGFDLPLPYVHGPFLYLYTRSLTEPNDRRLARWLHFASFVAPYVLLFDFLRLPAADRLEVYRREGAGYEHIIVLLNSGLILSGVGYVAASLYELRRYRRSIRDRYSNTEQINLTWLRGLILGIATIWLSIIFGHDESTFALATLFVVFIGYFGIKQVGILDRTPGYAEPVAELPREFEEETDLPAPTVPGEKLKYEKSGLRDEQVADVHRRLTELMRAEQAYKIPELTLLELARRLDIHPNYLSQVINTVEGKNFYDYINCQRVEEFARLVQQPENQRFTLLALAFECGFSSKTAFNRNFKKATGLSPSEYLERMEIHLN